MPEPTRENVRAHYAELAAHYDDRANKACKRAYVDLVRRTLGDAGRVLEIGAGSSPLLAEAGIGDGVACDLSFDMLAARRAAPRAPRTQADGAALPYADASFDGVYCINVLEHAPEPEKLIAEAARVLKPGGRFVAVTPNGDVEWLLDLLERLRLKLPEGPHCFLTARALVAMMDQHVLIDEQASFLAFPAGPSTWVRAVDRLIGAGLFQYVVGAREND